MSKNIMEDNTKEMNCNTHDKLRRYRIGAQSNTGLILAEPLALH